MKNRTVICAVAIVAVVLASTAVAGAGVSATGWNQYGQLDDGGIGGCILCSVAERQRQVHRGGAEDAESSRETARQAGIRAGRSLPAVTSGGT